MKERPAPPNGRRLGGSLQFFVDDVSKITILLCVLIFVISYIQSYFPPERSRASTTKELTRHRAQSIMAMRCSVRELQK